MEIPTTRPILTPDDEGYDEARRVFNGMIDRRPARIVRCANAHEVAAGLMAARAEGLPVSVYGGGHSVTGSAVVDDGVCLDLRLIDDIAVDAERRELRVGGGARWGEVDAVTQEHGLAVTGGRVSTTGVGGLALGSGSGWIERYAGLTCDSLLEAEVVTADGRIVMASEKENPDLFWAIRGGGGNFGIVTHFTFRLHEVGPIVLGGMLLYPGHMAREVLSFWRDFVTDGPDALGSGVALITAPPADFVPEPARGKPAVGVIICYVGPLDEAEHVLAPMREFGPPAVDLLQPMPYVAVQQLLDPGNPAGMHNYWSGDFLAEFPDEAIDAFVSHAQPPVSPMSQMIVVAGGGVLARVEEDAMAFGQRQAPFNLHLLSMWEPDHAQDQANIDFTRRLVAAMQPWTTGNAYLNFIGDEGVGRVEAAFGPEKYARLQQIKAVWDPTNVFCHNQNIVPATAPAATTV
ncbi:FAD-binding oxidoreductase [Nocardioides sp. LS1]|uniref:FAD-binding oxidoreductase n=1 Tax=Nocardioides sp. LS1 TaxID=1027620 RepID=UPI000F61EA37|nr:FAD-binding oxidoreductase [Nocardioides sp. LS1]GCD92205.1 FAD-linked oxidase [Nocardioides sp. LS1]